MSDSIIERIRAGDRNAIVELCDWWKNTCLMYGSEIGMAYLTAGVLGKDLEVRLAPAPQEADK